MEKTDRRCCFFKNIIEKTYDDKYVQTDKEEEIKRKDSTYSDESWENYKHQMTRCIIS